MIRRNTWILIVLLAVLVAFSLYWKDLKSKQAAQVTPTAGSTMLISGGDGAPTHIRLQSSIGQMVEFGRDQSGTWVVTAPTAAAADPAGAEAAATQIGALQVLANVELGPDVVGLDKPAYTVAVTFATGKVHRLVVGSVTPIQNGYYCQLDNGPIQIVDKPGIDALLDLLTHPPYLATLTPVASPTPSPAPVTVTPQGSPTLPPTLSSGTDATTSAGAPPASASASPQGTLTPAASFGAPTATGTP